MRNLNDTDADDIFDTSLPQRLMAPRSPTPDSGPSQPESHTIPLTTGEDSNDSIMTADHGNMMVDILLAEMVEDGFQQMANSVGIESEIDLGGMPHMMEPPASTFTDQNNQLSAFPAAAAQNSSHASSSNSSNPSAPMPPPSKQGGKVKTPGRRKKVTSASAPTQAPASPNASAPPAATTPIESAIVSMGQVGTIAISPGSTVINVHKGNMTPASAMTSPDTPASGAGKKRQRAAPSTPQTPTSASRRGRAAGSRTPGTESKRDKGLRQFSWKVCMKVREKNETSYNEVADELVQEFAKLAQEQEGVDEEKNIRRRVYDALNVLEALDIIQKDRREIKWKGFPSNAAADTAALNKALQQQKSELEEKAKRLETNVVQYIGLKRLLQRNGQEKYVKNTENHRLWIPFLVAASNPENKPTIEMTPDNTSATLSFPKPYDVLANDVRILELMGLHDCTPEQAKSFGVPDSLCEFLRKRQQLSEQAKFEASKKQAVEVGVHG